MSSEAAGPAPGSPSPREPGYPVASVRPAARGVGILGCLLGISVLCNLFAVAAIIFGCLGAFGLASRATDEIASGNVHERFYFGNRSASDAIAIVHLDGVIMEGALDFVHKEIERAAADNNVKAVVLRINSPGGSITASDDLYHRLLQLRDGNADKKLPPKPLVVSMSALAASGGYYVAMPGKPILAERTTMTGSIGVFASLPNVAQLGEKVGFSMSIIKQGKIKDSGSPFKKMSPEETQVWQDLVDTAYDQFVQVVETGRPNLKGKLLQPIMIHPVQAGPPDSGDKKKPADYQRYRADGGIFTADKALQYGLVDRIGFLEDAIKEAKKLAGLGDNYKAVDYEKPKAWLGFLLDSKARTPTLLEIGRLRSGLTPRLWYLAPGSELTGLLAATEAGQSD